MNIHKNARLTVDPIFQLDQQGKRFKVVRREVPALLGGGVPITEFGDFVDGAECDHRPMDGSNSEA
jgi:hypothetical protein